MNNKKFLAVFDIDGTLFRWQLFHELVFKLYENNLIPKDVGESLNQAFKDWRGLKASWNEYEDKVVSAIDDHIANINPKDFEDAAKEVVETSGHKVYAYTADLVKNLKNQGYYLLAITGSHQEIAEIFAKQHGFDYCIGALHSKDDKGNYDGSYARFTYNQKGTLLKEFVKEKGITLDNSYAIGDSKSDIDMLSIVDYPIAFNPSVDLLNEATKRHWPIVIERKNIIYKLKHHAGEYVLSDTKIF